MSVKTKKTLITIMTFILILLTLVNLPYKKIKDNFNTIIIRIDDFIKNIDSSISSNNSSSDHHVRNISFFPENNNYYAIIDFYSINPQNIYSIVINDITFTTVNFTFEQDSLIVNITSLIFEDEITPINVSLITTKTGKEHISTLSTSFHKAINYRIIEEKKKSLVGIRGTKSLIFNSSSTWGSGIILSKKEIIKSIYNFNYTMYEYLIVTNHHVVENSNIFFVYNKNENDEYPKRTIGIKPSETVELIGSYTNGTDLAFLLLTTYDDSLVPLNDEQFINSEAVTVNNDDIVFVIGSPFINGSPGFNFYKIGQVKNVNSEITLKDTTLCSEGCNSIKTSAYLGEGSSGGGLFDINGNLIGIHFAGSNSRQEAYAIPLLFVFEALNELLPSYIIKTETLTQVSVFYSIMIFYFSIKAKSILTIPI